VGTVGSAKGLFGKRKEKSDLKRIEWHGVLGESSGPSGNYGVYFGLGQQKGKKAPTREDTR